MSSAPSTTHLGPSTHEMVVCFKFLTHPKLLAQLTTFLPTVLSKMVTYLMIPSPLTMKEPRVAHLKL